MEQDQRRETDEAIEAKKAQGPKRSVAPLLFAAMTSLIPKDMLPEEINPDARPVPNPDKR